VKRYLLIVIFSLLTNVCFAQDIYTTTDNGFVKYLRTESLKAKVLSRTENKSFFEMTYCLICVPDENTVDQLKSQTFDNKLSFRKQTFTFKCSFDPNKNQWNQDGSIWIKNDEFWGDSPQKCLYKAKGNMPGGLYYGDLPEAATNRAIVLMAYNYVTAHKLIEYD
jgi:hypothetical protein